MGKIVDLSIFEKEPLIFKGLDGETYTIPGNISTKFTIKLSHYHQKIQKIKNEEEALEKIKELVVDILNLDTTKNFNVIPTASALGVEFGNVTAALASMTAQGTPTSVATTQLRQLLVELSKDGGKAALTFQKLSGKSFKDFIASGKNVQDALKLMEQYAKESNVGINDLFSSVEAGNAALSLTGKGTESFANNLKQMANSAGATDKAFNTMDQGIGRSISKIKANLATMLLDVGDKLAPTVAELAKWVETNMPNIQKIVNDALTAIGTVIGLVVEIIKTFIFILKEMYNENKAVFDGIKNVIVSVLNFVITFIKATLALIKGDWSGFNQQMENLTKNFWELIKNIFKLALDFLDSLLGGAVSNFLSHGKNMMNALMNSFKNVWESIKIWFTNALNNLFNWFASLQSKFYKSGQDMITNIWNSFKNVWASIRTWFQTAINNLIAWFSGLYKSFKNVGINILTGVLDGLKSKWESLKSWISDKVDWILDKLDIWEDAQDTMSSSKNSSSSKSSSSSSSSSSKTIVGGDGDYYTLNPDGSVTHKDAKTGNTEKIVGDKELVDKIKKYATGGIITSPTLALMGESGTEAVFNMPQLTNLFDILNNPFKYQVSNANKHLPENNINTTNNYHLTVNIESINDTKQGGKTVFNEIVTGLKKMGAL